MWYGWAQLFQGRFFKFFMYGFICLFLRAAFFGSVLISIVTAIPLVGGLLAIILGPVSYLEVLGKTTFGMVALGVANFLFFWWAYADAKSYGKY